MIETPSDEPSVASRNASQVVLIRTLSLRGNSRAPPPSVIEGMSTAITPSPFFKNEVHGDRCVGADLLNHSLIRRR